MAHKDKRSRYMNLVGEAIRKAIGEECLIVFFGSVLDDRFGVTSDIDVAVLCDRALTPLDMFKIEEEIDRLPMLRDVDVVDIRSVRDTGFMRAILKGKVWKSSPELMKDLRELCKSIER